MHSDGFLRLQTVRYESVNLIEQVIDTDALSATSSGNAETAGNPETTGIPETAGNPETAVSEIAGNSEAANIPEMSANPDAIGILEMAGDPETVGIPEMACDPETTGIPDMAENHPDNLEEMSESATSVPVATTSGGGDEVSITYNLEMLGDVALLTPNKLGVDVNAKQGVVMSDEGIMPGDMCLKQEAGPNLHCPDLMDPSTSSLTEIPDPQSMNVEVVAKEDQESLSDNDHSDLFGIYSEISSSALNSV